MNIFLLFISMFIMIGYYIMSSPSQSLPEQETEYVIQQSDVRSIIECVVAKHNSAMYCQPFKDECVVQYGVESRYVDISSSGSLMGVGSMDNLCEDSERSVSEIPQMKYIITTSNALSQSERDDVLDILETYYSDRGSLGIVRGSRLIVPNSTTLREIPEIIISAVGLTDDQLAYIIPYRLPTIPGPDEPGDDPEVNTCPPGTIATVRFGHTYCITDPGIDWCQENTIYNAETQECEPTEELTCEDENATLVNIDGTWVCYSPTEEVDCHGGILVFDTNLMGWVCNNVENPEEIKERCDQKNPGYVFSQSDLVTPTLHVKTVSCGRCEKTVLDLETCEPYCIPDISKINTRTCGFGDPQCCDGNDMGIYFGFTSRSRLDGLQDENGDPVTLPPLQSLLDRQHAQNRKFNCMRCKYSTIKTRIYPYVAICTDQDSSENVTTSSTQGSPCDTPVIVDDDDILSVSQELIDRGNNSGGGTTDNKEKDLDENTMSSESQVSQKDDDVIVLKPLEPKIKQ